MSGAQEDQEAPSHGLNAFNQASAPSDGHYDSPSPSHPQCQIVKLFYQARQWTAGRVRTDTVPWVTGGFPAKRWKIVILITLFFRLG